MSSRFSAARPKRAGEAFARQHHGGGDAAGSDEDRGASKVKFDIRNPSALAPDAREDDDILDADVIGVAGGATKRGAVNIDGYDSDSDNETFEARAEQRKRPGQKAGRTDADDVNLIDQLDNYDKRLKGEDAGGGDGDDDDDDDMFAENDDDDDDKKDDKKDADGKPGSRKSRKEVHFMSDKDIEGQEDESKGGGRVHLDDKAAESDDDSSDDDEKVALAIEEEGLDEEVGLGGLKKHAPKLMAFNMREEQEEGAFDESGNFVRKAMDPDAQHDRWMDGVSKKQMKRAAEAREKREAELRQTRRADDSIITADLFGALITRLELGETALEALARLGKLNAAFVKAKNPKAKRIPQWKLKQMEKKNAAKSTADDEKQADEHEGGDEMDIDRKPTAKTPKDPEDPEQTKIKESIEAITEAADKLLNRDYPEIYDMERERLVREYRAETGEAWVEPSKDEEAEEEESSGPRMWEYRWVDGRDGGAKQGPYDGPTMKAWQDAGYFEGVEFRPAGNEGAWHTSVAFV
ncbi:lin1 family protein [Ophiostoma piceae UAMH 11346]|uniref:Lin1 family protein n=1 Tax=Ophiostoma piceae (strain UAMH 11346) TaxID=1262450 RepID=S3D2F1_OPHP1|nr:lin1 family protein [Ophiostoma piceae UAMH 11346]